MRWQLESLVLLLLLLLLLVLEFRIPFIVRSWSSISEVLPRSPLPPLTRFTGAWLKTRDHSWFEPVRVENQRRSLRSEFCRCSERFRIRICFVSHSGREYDERQFRGLVLTDLRLSVLPIFPARIFSVGAI